MTLLKALEKSILTNVSSAHAEARYSLAACEAASRSLRPPVPSCNGSKKDWNLRSILRETHLAVRRLSVSPIAMGRMPPHFFARDVSVALDRTGLMNSGRSPHKNKLQNSVTDARSWLPASFAEEDTASFRCCGRSPAWGTCSAAGRKRECGRTNYSFRHVQLRDLGGRRSPTLLWASWVLLLELL